MPFGISETDGAFRTVGVPPGPYALVALPAPTSSVRWRTASVLLDHRNVFDSAFDVGTADIQDVVVTMRLRMCTLSGNVRDASRVAAELAQRLFTATPLAPILRRACLAPPSRQGAYIRNCPTVTTTPRRSPIMSPAGRAREACRAREDRDANLVAPGERNRLTRDPALTRGAFYAARLTSFSTCPSRT